MPQHHEDDPDATELGGAAGSGPAGSGARAPAPFPSDHPAIPGFELVMTPPLPPYLAGGFGRVYRALNSDSILVAIKVPRPETGSPQAAERWTHECALSRAFPTHENVVRFFPRALARWPHGGTTDALVMEWLDGARGLIRYADDVGLDKPARVQLLLQAVEGVAWMHSHGTPHCDLKSDNMLVIERLGRPVVKVTDFGGTRSAQQLDPRGSMYTRHRAAPEVENGDPAAITPRADVYSLAKECAELIGGPAAVRRPPGARPGPWQPQPLRDSLGLADPALDQIIEHGTRPEPRDRYGSAAELREALLEYQPPLKERGTRWIEGWVWPAARTGAGGDARRRGTLRSRIPLVFACLALLGTLASWALTNQAIATGCSPAMVMAPTAPADLSRVLLLREKTPDGIARLAQRLGIVGVEADSPATKRLVWARIIRRLAAERPDAIALDIALPQRAEPELNKVILEAVDAAVHGPERVPVIVSVQDYAPGHPEQRADAPMIAGLAEAGALWGCYNLAEFYLCGNALPLPYRQNAEVRLPLSVAAVAGALGRKSPQGQPLRVQVDSLEGRVRFLGGPALGVSSGLFLVQPGREIGGVQKMEGVDELDMVGIYPIGVPSDEAVAEIDHDVLSLASPEGALVLPNVRDRVVLLANYDAKDFVDLSGRRVPGSWVQAAAIQSLLTGIDAVQPTRWTMLPMGLSLAAGMLIALPLAAACCHWLGVPVPSLGGRWQRSRLPARAIVHRLRWIALSVALLAFVLPVAVHLVGAEMKATVPYTAGACAISAYLGVLIGVAVVCAGAWIGCVRRAWCLDRAPLS